MFCVLPERMCARRKYERIYVVVEGECRFFVAYWSCLVKKAAWP